MTIAPGRLRAVVAAVLAAAWLALALAAPGAARAAADAHREVRWDDLMPKGWNPLASFRHLNLGLLSDSDPKAQEMMKRLREVWDNAPTNPEIDGQAIKLPGYVVPLEESKGELREFLLVPYYGACIHTPPPPANQIVHVVAGAPLKGYRAMDVVWVRGTLKAERADSAMGVSGYRMESALVERFVMPAR